MPELNPKHLQAVMMMINRGFYFKHLSMFVKDMGVGYSLVEVDIGESTSTRLADFMAVSTRRRSTRPLIGRCMGSSMKMRDTSRLI